MKKIFILVLMAVLASGCSALTGQPPASSVDTQATIDSIVHTAAAQTLAVQPSPTTVPPTDTGTPFVADSPTTTEVATNAPSSTPVPNLTTTPVTATAGTVNPAFTVTVTKPVTSSGSPTVTPTLGILTYGTLPPAVPSAGVTIFNKSKAQAYISLQNDAIGRPDTVLEYPVEKSVSVRAPLGYYVYVVWVGGNKITGEFFLSDGDDLTITIFKDQVVVQ